MSNNVPDFMPVLSRGEHSDPKEGACIMEYASFLSGEAWSDSPSCTHPVLAEMARSVNDKLDDDRRQELLPLLPRLMGTADEDRVLSVRLAVWCAQQVAHLNPDDRVRVAIESALAWCDKPCEETAAAANAATYAANAAATAAATYAATRAATDAATYAATDAATYAATDAATDAADAAGVLDWFFVNGDLAACALALGVGTRGMECAQKSWKMHQGGNQWSSFDCFLSFFRHVAKLDLDYSNWDAWETLSLHSSYRIIHHDFCIISDRPERLVVDNQNRPHNDAGPFCRWRDGSALYSIHGHRVPGWIVEHPDRITIEKIHAETNAETRRIMIARYRDASGRVGTPAYLLDAGAMKIDDDPSYGTLYRLDRPDDTPLMMVRVRNNTTEPDDAVREFFLRVHPELRPMMSGKKLGRPQKMTARNAVASTWGMRGENFAPEART